MELRPSTPPSAATCKDIRVLTVLLNVVYRSMDSEAVTAVAERNGELAEVTLRTLTTAAARSAAFFSPS